MNLFKSELFNSVMLQELQLRPLRSHRTPVFGRRYGRRGAAAMPGSTPFASLALTTIEMGAVEMGMVEASMVEAGIVETGTRERPAETRELLDYDQAA